MTASPTRSFAREPYLDAQYTDKTLTCAECQSDFVWTAGEQRFFAEKRFTNPPKRCKTCRDKRKRA